jgi:hypothetical protein
MVKVGGLTRTNVRLSDPAAHLFCFALGEKKEPFGSLLNPPHFKTVFCVNSYCATVFSQSFDHQFHQSLSVNRFSAIVSVFK